MKKFKYSRMLLMHALLYKRENLLKSGTILPEHTFYVDNLFAYKPLPFIIFAISFVRASSSSQSSESTTL